jgi:hypothetical protein
LSNSNELSITYEILNVAISVESTEYEKKMINKKKENNFNSHT